MNFFNVSDKISEAFDGALSLIKEQLDEIAYILNVGYWYIPFAFILIVVLLYIVLVNFYDTNN